LRKKAENEGILVPDGVAEFIAQRVPTNIRELEGALVRVVAYASLTRSTVSVELAGEVLRDLLPAARSRVVTILTDASLPRIGEEFGGRDHTTVMHACQRVREALKRDTHLAATLKRLMDDLQRHGG
jgi:chromosomal replication initiator protein